MSVIYVSRCLAHNACLCYTSNLSWSFKSPFLTPDEKAKEKRGIHPIKAIPFCQSLGSLVAIYITAWSWDIIIVYCLIFHLHYTLLQRFRNHAESERKPFHADQYLWLYYLSATADPCTNYYAGLRSERVRWQEVMYNLYCAKLKVRCMLSVGVCHFIKWAVGLVVC